MEIALLNIIGELSYSCYDEFYEDEPISIDGLTWTHGTTSSKGEAGRGHLLPTLLPWITRQARSFFLAEIEFNITGNYGSPVHVNHNANYSSMPSPDMDPADRRQPEQARRPLSVATDNMMLEFYKKDGYELESLSPPRG